MNRFEIVIKYLKYKLFAKHRKGFGVHSPFLFDFITNVLYSGSYYYAFDEIGSLREELLASNEETDVLDFGAGSRKMKSSKRKISDIVQYSGMSEKFGMMLFRLIQKYKPNTILELGTSLGLGTSYMSKANVKANVTTIEACPFTAGIAAVNFQNLGIKNIHQIIGDIDEKLGGFISGISTLDFVYFDGNHQKEATLKYFNMCKSKAHNDSIFCFDDIRWTKGMEEAWTYVKADKDVTLTVDLFSSGVIFFKKELSKQDFIVKF